MSELNEKLIAFKRSVEMQLNEMNTLITHEYSKKNGVQVDLSEEEQFNLLRPKQIKEIENLETMNTPQYTSSNYNLNNQNNDLEKINELGKMNNFSIYGLKKFMKRNNLTNRKSKRNLSTSLLDWIKNDIEKDRLEKKKEKDEMEKKEKSEEKMKEADKKETENGKK